MNTRVKAAIGAAFEGVSWFLETLSTALLVGAGFTWGALTVIEIYATWF